MEDNPSNADPAAVRHFSGMAADWWDPNGAFRTLHDINPARLAYLCRHARLSGCRVLDVGCGGGIFSEAMARSGAVVTGLDIGPENVASAAAHARESGLEIEYLDQDAEAFLRTGPAPFPVLVCMELLEHVPDPAALIRTCAALLAEGGVMVLATLNRTLWSWLGAIVVAERLTRWIPAGTHDYGRFIRPAELAAWCRDSGLLLEDISGMRYSPVSRRARVAGAPVVNYLCAVRKPVAGEGV